MEAIEVFEEASLSAIEESLYLPYYGFLKVEIYTDI